ncbi:LytR/AlgR family response regulator transcription factor [Anaerobium acetethylicum]|uniref:Stage 0 sporulation protein A homolog n=1 Tax=Anaerobium acetethylicum TaxID=1619234 RepID=A0A1D3TWM5_9FIRM|nr:LytTR family DNA-binding domain-containing protein [Anaerobium acetethylicum]SCP98673.1 DNA-binding response regulator, LytR/AlgR family [Anaerobium acetethylicum]
MKLAVIDDDKKATDLLDDYVKRFEKENNMSIQVSVFHNPNDFLNNYSRDYDLVLMDIEMPGLNGIETAKELRRMDSRVVLMFITNMAQYAIHGYEVEAVDFVIKPVSYPDFVLKIQKAIRYIARNQDQKLTLHAQEGVVHLHVSDIRYIEVIRHYLLYHTAKGNYTVRGVMKEAEESLEKYHFVRSNHCYLVNLKYVESISGNIVKVGGDDLQISRNKKNEFLMKFTRYVGGMQ